MAPQMMAAMLKALGFDPDKAQELFEAIAAAVKDVRDRLNNIEGHLVTQDAKINTLNHIMRAVNGDDTGRSVTHDAGGVGCGDGGGGVASEPRRVADADQNSGNNIVAPHSTAN